MTDKLLDVRGAADYLGLTPSGVYKLVRSRGIPAFKLGGTRASRLRFRRSELDAWLEERRVAHA